MNNNEVLEFTFKSKLSEFSSRLTSIKKDLWKSNRKSHTKLKETFKVVDDLREKTRYYVMTDNEMTVRRGLEIIENLTTSTKKYMDVLNSFYNEKSYHFIEELNSMMKEIEALRVMVRLSDHEQSIFPPIN